MRTHYDVIIASLQKDVEDQENAYCVHQRQSVFWRENPVQIEAGVASRRLRVVPADQFPSSLVRESARRRQATKDRARRRSQTLEPTVTEEPKLSAPDIIEDEVVISRALQPTEERVTEEPKLSAPDIEDKLSISRLTAS